MATQAGTAETGTKINPYEVTLSARTGLGSSATRRVRREGLIPAVVYERGKPAVSATMNYQAFEQQALRSRISQLFTMSFSDVPELDKRPAIIKEVQRDHLSGRLLHVDFQALRDDEEVVVRIPLTMVGEAAGVKTDGGVLSVATYEIAIKSLPRNIPAILEVDVSKLLIGQSIHANELQLPKGASLAGNPDETIVSVVVVRQVVEETPAAGAAAPAEGAAAAAGATPADGAAAAAAAPAKGADDKKAAPAKDAKK